MNKILLALNWFCITIIKCNFGYNHIINIMYRWFQKFYEENKCNRRLLTRNKIYDFDDCKKFCKEFINENNTNDIIELDKIIEYLETLELNATVGAQMCQKINEINFLIIDFKKKLIDEFNEYEEMITKIFKINYFLPDSVLLMCNLDNENFENEILKQKILELCFNIKTFLNKVVNKFQPLGTINSVNRLRQRIFI